MDVRLERLAPPAAQLHYRGCREPCLGSGCSCIDAEAVGVVPLRLIDTHLD